MQLLWKNTNGFINIFRMIQIVRFLNTRVKSRLFRLGLQFLVKIASDLHLPERETYEAELKQVNKRMEVERQVRHTFKNFKKRF